VLHATVAFTASGIKMAIIGKSPSIFETADVIVWIACLLANTNYKSTFFKEFNLQFPFSMKAQLVLSKYVFIEEEPMSIHILFFVLLQYSPPLR